MKKLWLATGVASGLLLMVNSASAHDVRIDFHGKVSNSTCNIGDSKAPGGMFTQDVYLPTVSTNGLSKINDVAGIKPFSINLSGCTGSKVTTQFSPGPTVDKSTGALINQAPGGSSAQVQLLNSQSKVINLATSDGAETLNIENQGAVFQFYAQYFAAQGAVTAGAVETSVMLDLAYE